MGTVLPAGRAPRFRIGDQVIVVGPGPEKGNEGEVIRVVEGSLDFVHRYHVRFSDRTWATFFGFELEPVQNQSLKSA